MAESEKREKILKQELVSTQKQLSAAERVIDKLQEQMKKMEQDKTRLNKFKNSGASRLKELEDKIKKFEVYDNVDTEKLIQALDKRAQEVESLRSVADNFNKKLNLE